MCVCTRYVFNTLVSNVIASVELHACRFKQCLMHKLCLYFHVFTYALANVRHLFKGIARYFIEIHTDVELRLLLSYSSPKIMQIRYLHLVNRIKH